MRIIQDVVVTLFLVGNIIFTGNCAQAQAGERQVEVTVGFTEVCTRSDENTLECTRFVGGKATLVETCEVTNVGVVCSSVK